MWWVIFPFFWWSSVEFLVPLPHCTVNVVLLFHLSEGIVEIKEGRHSFLWEADLSLLDLPVLHS